MRYRGQVQGVGFRATCRSIARDYRVTGWVRNEPDASVTLEAQGAADELDRFEEAIRGRLGANITGCDRCGIQTCEAESGFEIRWDGGQR